MIQEHHASSLHWDFRLERDGVLVSWALPKGLPPSPDVNHLAVHVEDHPLEYGTFAGTIPEGEYGGGTVTVWDHGTYRCEKWNDHEVMVVLDGARARGRYVLFPTRGKNWMIHRMDPVDGGYGPLPAGLKPMLATAGTSPPTTGRGPTSSSGTASGPSLGGRRPGPGPEPDRSRHHRQLPRAPPAGRGHGQQPGPARRRAGRPRRRGRPSFSRLQHRLQLTGGAVARAARDHPVSIVLFDLLHLNGHSLLDAPYDQRRTLLEQLGVAGPSFAVTPSFTDEVGRRRAAGGRADRDGGGGGQAAGLPLPSGPAEHRLDQGEGPTDPGGGGRRVDTRPGQPAVDLRRAPPRRPVDPSGRTLTFVGKVGSGFTQADGEAILARLRKVERKTSPSTPHSAAPVVGEPHWVRPTLVGEVQFTEWTPDGHLRHPVGGPATTRRPAEVTP